MNVDRSSQNELFDPDRVGDDVNEEPDDEENDDVDQINLPDVVGFYAVHPEEKHDRRRAQLDPHEIGLVDHKHRRDDQKDDEHGRGVFRLVARNENAEQEQHGDRQIDQKLRGERIGVEDEKHGGDDRRIDQGDQIKGLVLREQTVDEGVDE